MPLAHHRCGVAGVAEQLLHRLLASVEDTVLVVGESHTFRTDSVNIWRFMNLLS